MSWTCPNQIKGDFCGLRKKECEPSSDGCVLLSKFKIVGDETNQKSGKTKENEARRNAVKK